MFHGLTPCGIPARADGPTITSMSSLITEPLDAYLSAFQWEAHGNETPYLFHPTDDTTRCLPSSQWSGVVKTCFKKHSPNHVAPPPKLLRASFITWLRDSTDAPDVLKAAAKAMRHKEATQQSDRCTRRAHGVPFARPSDRLRARGRRQGVA
jgi:hypothetical protein